MKENRLLWIALISVVLAALLVFYWPGPLPGPTCDPTPAPTPTPTPDYGMDEHEPNGSFDSAWGPLFPGVTNWSYMYGAEDEWDFYYLDMLAARSLQAWLGDMPAGADFHLHLFDDERKLLAYSGNPANVDDFLSTERLIPGRYYVAVQRVTGLNSALPYALRITFR